MNNKKEVSDEYFMDWVQRMIEDCKKVTNIIPGDVLDLTEYPDVGMGAKIIRETGFVTSAYGYDADLSSGTNMRRNQYNIFLSYDRSYFRITNIVNGKSGYSKKLQNDSFDARIALAVAWARYCKNPIPRTKDYLNKIQFLDLENGNIFYSKNGQKFIVIGIEPQTKDMMVVYREKDKNLKEIVTIPYIPKTYSFKKEL